jgi:hypothetical protein
VNVELNDANDAKTRESPRAVDDLAPRNTDSSILVFGSARPLGRLVSKQTKKGPVSRTIDVLAERTGRFARFRVIRVSPFGPARTSSQTAS